MSEKVFEERTVASETLFQGKIIDLERLRVQLPDGREATREVVRHPGAVAVLAEPTPGSVVLVKQYRKALDESLVEIPAGKLEPGESPEVCAVRELREETGLAARSVNSVFDFFTSPGFADERIYLYYTNDVEQEEQALDEDEFVEVTSATRDEVTAMLRDGSIRDAKTLIALLWWIQQSNGR
ncbi:NUDIX hydrolase [Alicyclobacillus pomorum]|jgi:ADP-ribose pyrophosphatase|uniref:NUDIX hydrolase n=1 Tax=Alicyclobacillus pomorum TaxID=204470 RepID=UPI000406FFF8|nr:NUDIX hydrolase [Alicyclobacillus pomorum]